MWVLLVGGLALVVGGCGNDEAGPPAGSPVYSACEATADCAGGVCLKVLGQAFCASACDGVGASASCVGGVAGSCDTDGKGNFGCRPTCDDGSCPGGLECVELGDGTICVHPDATAKESCSSGFSRCGGVCVATLTDKAHCGGCDQACPAQAECTNAACECPMTKPDICGGQCVSKKTSLEHCGNCNAQCVVPNASGVCNAGSCELVACDPGWLSCDESSKNGCEVEVAQLPNAHIIVGPKNQVDPLTLLTLDGGSSTSPHGDITSWTWSATQPTGGKATFVPNSTSAQVSFEAQLVGTYSFTLEVVDSEGNTNCKPGTETVLVVPQALVHFELTWTGDADLDLHFSHEDALPDPWFNPTLDCYSANPAPQWGDEVDDKDDPQLISQSDDGSRPEILSIRLPEFEHNYKLAVYHVAGEPALASLKIHINEKLAYERKELELVPQDLWDVGTLTWETEVFTAKQDAIVHDFEAP